MMGGDISATSTVGQGSTFTIRLPMEVWERGSTYGSRGGGAPPPRPYCPLRPPSWSRTTTPLAPLSTICHIPVGQGQGALPCGTFPHPPRLAPCMRLSPHTAQHLWSVSMDIHEASVPISPAPQYIPRGQLAVRWVPLVPSFQRLGAFALILLLACLAFLGSGYCPIRLL